ncbi:MAG: response regulator [Candidatus Levybacteria bacterium]|nr:response regulator [Candidatus Levybacteria bacterium]
MNLGNLFKKSGTEPKSIKPQKTKIFIAEDDEYLRDFYKELLVGEGYEVITAVNGQEALRSILQTQPKVILLDVMMPVMDGLQVLEELKKNEQTKNIPVIVLTNAGTIGNMETAKYHKSFRFLIKSNIVPEELIKSVKDAVDSYTSHNVIL